MSALLLKNGDDQISVVRRYHDAATLSRNESTVARIAIRIEILCG